jgi:transposase
MMSSVTGAAQPFALTSDVLGALPIVSRFIERAGIEGLLERYLPRGERGQGPSPARVIGVLVRNLCVAHEPLYGLQGWAQAHDPGVLGLRRGESGQLNDDRVGRALELLFGCDRASLLSELMLAVISAFGIDVSQLHNDSTSISVHGAYPDADGREHDGKATPRITFGHSKARRPDLKQLVLILTVAADGAVPIAHRLVDGNTEDSPTHLESWEGLRVLAGRPDFLYVADCKLASRPVMAHIDEHGGRFLTPLPAGRNESKQLREWMITAQPAWTQAASAPSRYPGDNQDVWNVCEAPIGSIEGYRIIWVHSTAKQRGDQQARTDRIAKALQHLDTLKARLAAIKCRFHDLRPVEQAANAALTRAKATELINVHITEHIEERFREESRGPGRTPAQRRIVRARFQITWEINEPAVAELAAADGCYPLITNDTQLSSTELLAAYRYQPNLEKRHHQLKTVQHAAPIYLKNPARIEALFTCHFLALLISCLIERQARHAMTNHHITTLRLYPEDRRCTAPTAELIYTAFAPLTRHHLHQHNQHIQTFHPDLTPLQHQLLDLLNITPDAYTPTHP